MRAPTASALTALLHSLRTKLSSNRALAQQIGISDQHISRLLKGGFGLSVENCVRVARLAGMTPGDVLRMAEKTDIAEMLEHAYGVGMAHPHLDATSADEDWLLTNWRALTDEGREHLRQSMRLMLNTPVGRRRTRQS